MEIALVIALSVFVKIGSKIVKTSAIKTVKKPTIAAIVAMELVLKILNSWFKFELFLKAGKAKKMNIYGHVCEMFAMRMMVS